MGRISKTFFKKKYFISFDFFEFIKKIDHLIILTCFMAMLLQVCKRLQINKYDRRCFEEQEEASVTGERVNEE